MAKFGQKWFVVKRWWGRGDRFSTGNLGKRVAKIGQKCLKRREIDRFLMGFEWMCVHTLFSRMIGEVGDLTARPESVPSAEGRMKMRMIREPKTLKLISRDERVRDRKKEMLAKKCAIGGEQWRESARSEENNDQKKARECAIERVQGGEENEIKTTSPVPILRVNIVEPDKKKLIPSPPILNKHWRAIISFQFPPFILFVPVSSTFSPRFCFVAMFSEHFLRGNLGECENTKKFKKMRWNV